METINFFFYLHSFYHSCVFICLVFSPPTMEAWQCLFLAGCYWKTDACRDGSGLLTPGMLKSFQADLFSWKMSLPIEEGGLGGKWYSIREVSPSSPPTWSWTLSSDCTSQMMFRNPWNGLFWWASIWGPSFLHQDPPSTNPGCFYLYLSSLLSAKAFPFTLCLPPLSVADWVTVIIFLHYSVFNRGA